MTIKLRLVIVALLTASSSASAATGLFREFPLPTAGSGPTSIAYGPDGTIWFTEFHANKIGKISNDGTISEFIIPTPDSGPMGIARGVNEMWFTEFNANKIGRITPQGVITEYSIPTPDSGPFDIARAAGGDLWFSELRGNKIGRITSGGVISEHLIPTPHSEPMGVAAGPDGEIWFTEFRGNKIGTVFSDGIVREIAIPTPESGPADLSMAPGGRVWFTEFHANRIGRLYIDEAVTEFVVPAIAGGPWGIVADAYGPGAWFTARAGHKIGYIVPDARVAVYEPPTPAGEPMGIEQVYEKVWFAQRTGNSLGSVQADAVVIPGAGIVGSWDTDIRFASSEFQSTTVFAGWSLLPPTVCAGPCPPLVRIGLHPLGADKATLSSIQSFPGLNNFYVRMLETGTVPNVHARLLNRVRPSQAGELPTIRLSTLSALNPSVLTFPGAARTDTKRSSLVLTAVSTFVGGVRFGPPGGVHVNVEALDNFGQQLGGSSYLLAPGSTLTLGDVLLNLGIPVMEDGQIRVRKIGGGDLLWGYLATATTDSDLVIIRGLVP